MSTLETIEQAEWHLRHERRAFWRDYLGERRGTYEYRCRRYGAVADLLYDEGLAHGDLIFDVGAGMCEFDRYLRESCRWEGQYVPVDGAIDGTDLETWEPPVSADFFVAIEVIEHLREPHRMLQALERAARKAVVITTPNPAAVDVIGIDRTHFSAVCREYLERRGWHVETKCLFDHHPEDTLVAVFPIWDNASREEAA